MVCLSHFGKSPAKSLTLEMGLPSPSLLLPGQSLFFTHNCRKKENPNNYHIPGSVARASKGGGGGLEGHQNSGPISKQRRQQRGRVQVPSSEELRGMAQGQVGRLLLLLLFRAG